MQLFSSYRRSRRIGALILVISGIAVAFACKSASGSSDDDEGEGTGSPSVSLGSQSGAIAVGVAGTAAFSVSTANVAAGTVGTIAWYSSSAGATTADAPAGITASVSAVAGNAATVTIAATAAAVQGTYYFKLTEGSATSSVATLRVCDWEFVGAEAFSAGAATYLSLKLDSSDVPYVAYSDGNNSGKATVMKYNSAASSWSAVGSAGFSEYSVQYTYLVIDSDDVPIVAANSGSATAWKYTSESSPWSNLGVFSSDMGLSISAALDESDNLYVAFRDTDNGDKAMVVCKNKTGSAWNAVGPTTGFSSGMASCVALALDSKGIPYTAYIDHANGKGITVMKYDGSSWSALGTEGGVSAGGQDWVSLAVGPDDLPYVAYMDTTNGYKATVMKYDSSELSWISVGSSSSSSYASASNYYCCPSLAISSSGTIYLAFTDGALARATVIKYEPSTASWMAVGRAKISPAEVDDFPSLVLDSSGTPYLGYVNIDDSKASVMRFR
jgi:hypothetical protein